MASMQHSTKYGPKIHVDYKPFPNLDHHLDRGPRSPKRLSSVVYDSIPMEEPTRSPMGIMSADCDEPFRYNDAHYGALLTFTRSCRVPVRVPGWVSVLSL